MNKKRVGNWSALFGEPKTFEYEVSQAKDFDAKWHVNSEQIEINFGGLPGWLAPLWASDGEWLYVRRPEGVWRSRVPRDLPAETSIIFIQKKRGSSGESGRMFMSFNMEPTGAWMDRFQEPCSPEDIDNLRDQRRDRQGVEVDFYAPPLTDFQEDAGRLIVSVGDLFCEPPVFTIERDWLVATDSKTSSRCAFPITCQGSEPAKAALMEGNLWIRFDGCFLDRFEVKVSCENR